MSTLRNTAAGLWQGSHVRKANIVLGVTGVILSAACAADQAVAPPTSPAAVAMPSTQGAVAPRVPTASVDASKNTSTKGDQKDRTEAQLDSLAANPTAYAQAVVPGGVAQFISCKPRAEKSQTRVIGPAGGEVKVAGHTFRIPAGALDSNVAITMTAPFSTSAELKFKPHGLHFNKPVAMTISYKGCTIPDSVVLGVSYVRRGATGTVVRERMPAHHEKATSSVSALTDHFSGYVVSWARK